MMRGRKKKLMYRENLIWKNSAIQALFFTNTIKNFLINYSENYFYSATACDVNFEI